MVNKKPKTIITIFTLELKLPIANIECLWEFDLFFSGFSSFIFSLCNNFVFHFSAQFVGTCRTEFLAHPAVNHEWTRLFIIIIIIANDFDLKKRKRKNPICMSRKNWDFKSSGFVILFIHIFCSNSTLFGGNWHQWIFSKIIHFPKSYA